MRKRLIVPEDVSVEEVVLRHLPRDIEQAVSRAIRTARVVLANNGDGAATNDMVVSFVVGGVKIRVNALSLAPCIVRDVYRALLGYTVRVEVGPDSPKELSDFERETDMRVALMSLRRRLSCGLQRTPTYPVNTSEKPKIVKFAMELAWLTEYYMGSGMSFDDAADGVYAMLKKVSEVRSLDDAANYLEAIGWKFTGELRKWATPKPAHNQTECSRV